MGEALEIAKALVSPAMKLMDMIGGAIGKAYEPRHKRKMADSAAYEINAVADAMRNVADFPVVYDKNGVAINSEDFTRLMQRAGTRLVLQETAKQNNIETVVDNAYEILEKETECSEEPVGQGWINRFFDSVADVSDGDLQKLWGKILANEIQNPKSISLRTLEIVKNMNCDEANIFQDLMPFMICFGDDVAFLPADRDLQKKYSILDGQYLTMDSCGLLQLIPYTELNINLAAGETKRNLLTEERLLSITNTSTKNIQFSVNNVYILTQPGRELYNILVSTPNNEYFEEWVRIFHNNSNVPIKCEIHKRVNSLNEKKEYAMESIATFAQSNILHV